MFLFFYDSHLNHHLIEKQVPRVETLAKCMTGKSWSPGSVASVSLFSRLFSLVCSFELGSCLSL